MKFLLVIGLAVIVGALMVGFRMYRDRNATSMEGTMRQFQRGLEALDPSNDPLARPENRASVRRTANGAGPMNLDPNRQQNSASSRDSGSAQER